MSMLSVEKKLIKTCKTYSHKSSQTARFFSKFSNRWHSFGSVKGHLVLISSSGSLGRDGVPSCLENLRRCSSGSVLGDTVLGDDTMS